MNKYIDEREDAGIDFTELLNKAIAEKRAKEHAEEVQRYEAEEIPEGEALTWNTTPEEIARINAGDREAVNRFYFDEENNRHIKFSAYCYFRKEQAKFKAIISIEDLTQQVYLDLANGLIKLRAFDRGISGAIFASFKFAPVGGLDEVFIVGERRRKKWAKERSQGYYEVKRARTRL